MENTVIVTRDQQLVLQVYRENRVLLFNVAVASHIIFYEMLLFLEQIVDCGMLHDARSLV